MNPWTDLLRRSAGIACHADDIRPGWVFVAIQGSCRNGNDYASLAEKKGATAVVTDQADHVHRLGIPVILVPDARAALAELASAFHRHPSKDLFLAGVTGTNGKTTVTAMLENVFAASGRTAGLIGTVRISTGRASFPSSLTTPDSARLQQYLAAMRDSGVTHAAMEVSAQGAEMRRADCVHFACGVLTNISPDHLDHHGGYDAYIAAKAQFIRLLAPPAPLFVNAADQRCLAMASDYAGPRITVGFGDKADLTVAVTRSGPGGSWCEIFLRRPLEMGDGGVLSPCRFSFHVPVPGLHNAANAAMAAAVALFAGLRPDEVVKGIASYRPVERRMNVFSCCGLTVIDDTALNPHSYDAVFRTARLFRRRITAVVAIRGQRGPAINAANAASLAYWHHMTGCRLIVTAAADVTGPADLVQSSERMSFLAQLPPGSFFYHDRLADSLRQVWQTTQPADLVLLLGAQGMDRGRDLLIRMAPQEVAHAPAAQPALGAL